MKPTGTHSDGPRWRSDAFWSMDPPGLSTPITGKLLRFPAKVQTGIGVVAEYYFPKCWRSFNLSCLQGDPCTQTRAP